MIELLTQTILHKGSVPTLYCVLAFVSLILCSFHPVFFINNNNNNNQLLNLFHVRYLTKLLSWISTGGWHYYFLRWGKWGQEFLNTMPRISKLIVLNPGMPYSKTHSYLLPHTTTNLLFVSSHRIFVHDTVNLPILDISY